MSGSKSKSQRPGFDLTALQEQLAQIQLRSVGCHNPVNSPPYLMADGTNHLLEHRTLMNALLALAGYMRAMRNR